MKNLIKISFILISLTFLMISCSPDESKDKVKDPERYIVQEVVRDINVRNEILEVRNFYRIHQKINEAVFNAELTPYMDASLEEPYTLEELEFRITSEELIRIPDPDEPEVSRDSVIKHRQDMDDIHIYRVMEKWEYDIEKYSYIGELKAIAPVFMPVYENIKLGTASVYWISIKELEDFLNENDMKNLSFYLFESFGAGLDAYKK